MDIERLKTGGEPFLGLANMTWNYRIIKHLDIKNRPYVGLHEVYYKDGKIDMWNDNIIVVAEDKDELISIIETMLSDAKKDAPILIESELPGYEPDCAERILDEEQELDKILKRLEDECGYKEE